MSVGKKVGKPRMSFRLVAAFTGLIVGAVHAAPAWAGSFTVNPVNINLPADRKAASLTVTNSGAAPVSVKVHTYAWTQAEGSDVRTPTTNVIASPPIFTIPAGKTQLLRIGLRSQAGPGAYRVVLEEIPRDKPLDGQIQVNLRLDLPLYVLAKGGGKADLSWRAWRDSAGDLFVEGANRGLAHLQVLELSAEQGGKRQLLSQQMGVVLPGSARRWKAAQAGSLTAGVPLALKIRSSSGESQAQIVLEQR
jgi:fimbrial chaperone protein